MPGNLPAFQPLLAVNHLLQKLQFLILKPFSMGQPDRRRQWNMIIFGDPPELAHGFLYRGKQPHAVILCRILVHTNGNHGFLGLAQNQGQHLQLLRCKSGKSVHHHRISLKKGGGLQNIFQPGQVIQGIYVALGNQRLIGGHHQTGFPYFFP